MSDVWITVEEATRRMLMENGVIRVEDRIRHGGRYLQAVNEHGASLFSIRIYDGSEHPLARPGMVLDRDYRVNNFGAWPGGVKSDLISEAANQLETLSEGGRNDSGDR